MVRHTLKCVLPFWDIEQDLTNKLVTCDHFGICSCPRRVDERKENMEKWKNLLNKSFELPDNVLYDSNCTTP